MRRGATHDVHVLKVSVKCTPAKVGLRRWPPARVRASGIDVGRNLAVLEVPDLDAGRGPQSGVDSSSGCIERGTVAVGIGVHDGAAAVSSSVTTVGVAGRSSGLASVAYCHSAARASVEGHLVLIGVVDALDDIDLALKRPILANHPACQS